eukprot:NODE_5715_length_303_cov_306.905512_g5103_i0.p2 GENE.NODE_5715_length_303_cov_306.905512_g5103_i0~~NODE_5715_length_303_cov_306.905512_g5103_i0.p2  ORF type:complete len:74 (-),score=20.58 NODE_5715_length_303_cov_306.905512_g5103_i0:82-276(-)
MGALIGKQPGIDGVAFQLGNTRIVVLHNKNNATSRVLLYWHGKLAYISLPPVSAATLLWNTTTG